MKSVRDVLHGGGSVLENLTTESARREALDALLDDFLDTPFRDHVQVASARHGTLVLCADSPAWGHRIRYLAPSILEYFQARGVSGVETVTISVQHESGSPPPSTPRSAPGLSPASARALESAADHLDNPDLARRLRAIARHRRR